jgi:site-specific recombinase XerD
MLVPFQTQEVVLDQLAERAREYAEGSRAANTVRAYESDLRAFCEWCRERSLTCLPTSAETVSLYAAWCAERFKPATIERKLAAIASAHSVAGYDPPTHHGVVKAVLRGIRRAKGSAQSRKRALVVDDLRLLLAQVGGHRLISVRDRALLLLGFAAALRRSELVGLDAGDLRFEREGVILRLRRSKTDQQAQGIEVAVLYGSDPATCPVRALQAWLDESGITEGPLFRGMTRHGNVRSTRLTERIVAAIVKQYAEWAGLDPSEYGGHSLRSGFATSAARAGKSEASIMRQTRHKSVTVARRYIREGTIFQDHAAAGIGL